MAGDAPLRIESGALAAEIAPLGAELVRFTDGGRELLSDGDPKWWSGRAPILFPIVGALVGDRYRLDGRDYDLPRHGFARRRIFTLIDRTAASATFGLAADAETRAVYPFDFTLAMRFDLTPERLAMTATVANRGDDVMPASLGFHPALRWPLPYGGARERHEILFEADEPAPIRRLDAAGLLEAAPRPSPVHGRRLILDDSLFVDDALIFDDLRSRRLQFGVPGERGLEVRFPAMPHLGLWTKPGAPFLCIEPWQGHADPAGYAGDLRARPGMIAIPPGASRAFAMEIATLAIMPAAP